MAQHNIIVFWQRRDTDFKYETFDRNYKITFSGGKQIEASNPPDYFGRAELPNPEELLLSAVSSCYILTFLAVACKQDFIIDSYSDKATDITDKDAKGKNCITEITLRPRIKFSITRQPDTKILKPYARESTNIALFQVEPWLNLLLICSFRNKILREQKSWKML